MQIDLHKPHQIIEINKDCDINLLYIGSGSDFVRTEIIFLHTIPNVKSRITIKAILDDNSSFDIEGKIVINKESSGVDTYLKIDCLLISNEARAKVVPSLEIHEDDVKAGHGATIGNLDPIVLNYLKAHGLDNEQSEELLIEAFKNS